MRVAALVYFEDGTTAARAKTLLSDLKDQLDDHPEPYDGAAIEYAVVNEYDPAIGAPVWYIP